MSFSVKVKDELSIIAPNTRESARAEIAALLMFSKAFEKDNCLIQIENRGVVDFLIDYLQVELMQNVPLKLTTSKSNKRQGSTVYSLNTSNKKDFKKIYNMFLDEDPVVKYKLKENSFNCTAFLRGAFLVCGSMNDPNKEYHLEFALNSDHFAQILLDIFNLYDFNFKKTLRKCYSVIYIKDSESIEDILTLMGATKASFSIMGIKVIKDVRNRANRATNCETANIDKTVFASSKQIEDINILIKTGAFDTIPDNLKEIALIRKSNPEMSLKEISEELGGKISKSGISHRFKKISNLADAAKRGKQ